MARRDGTTQLSRREALMAAAGVAATSGCSKTPPEQSVGSKQQDADVVLAVEPLGAPPWPTRDPFLFCVHHDDSYPAGNAVLGPRASLEGRQLGRDFAGKDGWRMYHGQVVPGFPQHPHRGFETVTVVRRGLLDHSDSLGAAARYGKGDVQWLTAGSGILHAEMFPLLEQSAPNPLELFQIWLNLPAVSKMVTPRFAMLWAPQIPMHDEADGAGRTTRIATHAGAHRGVSPASPPPDSWAARSDSDVAIWTIAMQAGAHWTLPAARPGSNRSLYFFRGTELRLADRSMRVGQRIDLLAHADVRLVNGGDQDAELLLLQGRPIGEPVVKHGPFVMNSEAEIRRAYEDYRATQFGGWPWKRHDPVHAADERRFARHADGTLERPV